MSELLTWLSTNPVALTAIIVLIAVIMLIYLVAFLQGREVSFWPPKIGAKPNVESRIPLPSPLVKKGETESLGGNWLSLFQFGKVGEMVWTNEEVEITDMGGNLIRLRSTQHGLGYKWEGEGKIIDNQYIYGEIHSVKPGAHSYTSFVLAIHRHGYCLYGRWITPNDKGKIITGSWVLGRQKAELAYAQKLVE